MMIRVGCKVTLRYPYDDKSWRDILMMIRVGYKVTLRYPYDDKSWT